MTTESLTAQPQEETAVNVNLIEPYGGKLVNLLVAEEKKQGLTPESADAYYGN